MSKDYIGYRADDFKESHATFYNESFEPIPSHAFEALAVSPLPIGALPPFTEAAYLEKDGYIPHENGYTQAADGSIHVAVRTVMPGVTPIMWDWFFTGYLSAFS